MSDPEYVVRVKLPSSSGYHSSPSGDSEFEEAYDKAIRDAMPSGFAFIKPRLDEKWAKDSEGRSMVLIRPTDSRVGIYAYVEEAKQLRAKLEAIKKIIG